jgi:rhodanese-related sulfurtransferase
MPSTPSTTGWPSHCSLAPSASIISLARYLWGPAFGPHNFFAGPTECYLSSMAGHVPQLTVEELKELRDRGEAPLLLDVREPHEYAFADLPGSLKVPLGTLPRSLDRIPKDRQLVVYCRSGARSANAVQFLLQMGYDKTRNLTGGVNAWTERIDPSMRKY